jgi:MFS family permease
MSDHGELYNRDYVLLNASNFLYSLFATIFIFMPAFLDSIGISPSRIGFIMATGTLVSVAFKPLGGWLADRTRKTFFIVGGALIASLATFPWFTVHHPSPMLYLYRFFQGVGYSFFVTFAYAHIASNAPPDRRAEALGVFGLSFFIPTAIGGGLGELVLKYASFNLFFLIGGVIALTSGIPVLFIRDRGKEAGLKPSNVRDLIGKGIWAHVILSLFFGTTFGGIFTFLPVFLYKNGREGIFLFIFFYSLAVISTRTVWRKSMDRTDKKTGAILSFALLSAGATSLIFAKDSIILICASLITGLGHGFLFPSLSALMVDRVGRENSGASMALFTGSFDLGLVIGSALLGIVLEYWGFPIMFFFCGLIPLLGVPLLLRESGDRTTPMISGKRNRI